MLRERFRKRPSDALIATFAVVGVLFVFPAVVHAAAVNLGLTPGVEGALGLGTSDIRVIAARIIRNFFGLLGIIAVCLILYGGFLWMTSGGNEETIDKAKRTIVSATIGLAIMLSAVAIAQFILSRLLEATGAGGTGPGGCTGAGCGYVVRSGPLGQGIIQDHYPDRGATDVARNTRIVITFKEEMDLASFIVGYDPADPASANLHDLNAAAVRIYKQADGIGGAFTSADVKVYYTPDKKTFVFLVPLLGSPTEDVAYIVDLAGGDVIKVIRNGKSEAAFTGSFGSGYQWDFTTGTFIDTTPPKVESVVPYPDTTNPRNTLIQVTFDEAVDPTSIDPVGAPNLSVQSSSAPGEVDGAWETGNRYRTVEFTSTDLCGRNTCGGEVYCLPGNAAIAVLAKAATLGAAPPQADPTIFPANGITDMTGNSLDGNGNGTAEGPGPSPDKDDYAWRFLTDNTIDLTPPVITATDPARDTPRVLPDKPIEATFSKIMSLISFNSVAVGLSALPTPPEPTCYVVSGKHLDASGEPVVAGVVPVRSRMQVGHCLLFPETNYVPAVSSKVKDIRQNCFYPGASEAISSCSPSAMAAGNYTYCCNGTPCAKACALQGTTAVCAP